LLKRNGAKKLVAISHGHEVWWAKLPPFKQIMRLSTRHLDYLTYLGDFTKGAMKPAVSPKCEMVQIAPGIDTSFFSPGDKSAALIKEFGLEGKRVVVSVGRLVHRKGQDKLLEALPLLIKKYPDLVLLFVGIGPRKEELDRIIKEHDLAKYVRFAGRVAYSRLPEYFRLGEIFAMPSRSRLAGLEVEGLGIVYLEASGCGIPVLGGESGGAPDAVQEGITGRVVDGRDPAEIARVLDEMLAHPELLKEMGAAGRQWALNTWSWKIWGEKFAALLQ
jgi:phosphatidylinositol alpha-1,6-mannosyltransferase